MIEMKKPAPPFFSSSRLKALKKKLRSLQWQPEAITREIVLMQKLRKLWPGKED